MTIEDKIEEVENIPVWKFMVALGKSLKNNVIVFVPAIVSVLSGMPQEFAPLTSIAVYMLKNYYEFKKGKKI